MIAIALSASGGVCDAELTEFENRLVKLFSIKIKASGLPEELPWIYEDRFLEEVAQSESDELKRAFILMNLPEYIERCLESLDTGEKRIGKSEYRKLTDDERIRLISDIEGGLDLWKELDSKSPSGLMAMGEIRARFDKAKNRISTTDGH